MRLFVTTRVQLLLVHPPSCALEAQKIVYEDCCMNANKPTQSSYTTTVKKGLEHSISVQLKLLATALTYLAYPHVKIIP